MAKQEQEKQLREDKRQIDEAIKNITSMTSRAAKEKYLKENFDQIFV